MTDDLQDIINDVERTVTDARKRYKEFTKYMDDLRDEIDNIFITLEQYQKQLQEILLVCQIFYIIINCSNCMIGIIYGIIDII